jgi:hypothetical protein
MRNTFTFWSESLKEKDHLKDVRMWLDNIRMDLREKGEEVVAWMHLAQDRASGGLFLTR